MNGDLSGRRSGTPDPPIEPIPRLDRTPPMARFSAATPHPVGQPAAGEESAPASPPPEADHGARVEPFQSITSAAPIGLFRTDADRRCLYTNARWQAITGLTLSDSLDYGWSRALHPDDRVAMLKEWSQAELANREFSCEHRVVTPLGAVRWVHTRAAPLLSENGQVTGYVGAVEDITERRLAEEALHASEQRFRALTERSWDAVSLIAADGTILYDNPAASTRILGYQTGELVGRNAFERLHPDDQPSIRGLFEQLLQQPGVSITAEFRYQHKDGSWRWIECAGTNLLMEPSVQAVVTNYRDVTERRRSEEEIRRRNRELAALHVITAAVSSSLELAEVVETFKRLLLEELDVPGGLIYFRDPSEEQYGLQDAWGIPEAILAELRRLPMTACHDERVLREKEAFLIPDFREVATFFALRLDVARPDWQSYLCVPLVGEGEVQGVVGLFSKAPRVFSEEQRAFFEALGREVGASIQHARLFEQVRAWRERLQHLSYRLVELQETERQNIARELHDEVGQLLTGLKLSLELYTRRPADQLEDNRAEVLDLVNELIARVRQLSLDLRPAMLDDLGLLPALLWHFERYSAQTQVQVKFEHLGLEQRFPTAVETAAYRIVQEALTNVARHAGVNEVTVRLWAQHGILGAQVQDEGLGFDPNDSAVVREACGLTGMRERAALLGGHLVVESAPGEGTRLTAELPLAVPSGEGEEGER